MTTRAQLIIQLLVEPPLQPVSQPVGRQHLVRQRDRIEQDQRAASWHDVAHALAAVLARVARGGEVRGHRRLGRVDEVEARPVGGVVDEELPGLIQVR